MAPRLCASLFVHACVCVCKCPQAVYMPVYTVYVCVCVFVVTEGGEGRVVSYSFHTMVQNTQWQYTYISFFRNLHKCTKHFDWHIVLHCANDASVPSSPMAKSSKYLQHSLPPILHLMIKINNKKTSDNLCRRNSRCHFNGSFYTWEQKCTVTTLESMIKQQMLGFFFFFFYCHCISKILWKVKKKKKKTFKKKRKWYMRAYYLFSTSSTRNITDLSQLCATILVKVHETPHNSLWEWCAMMWTWKKKKVDTQI